MRRLSGQAALGVARLLHLAAGLALAVVVLGGVGLALLGWRLSQGPLELPWLTQRIEASVNADSRTTRLSIGSAALAWEGFNKGVDRPLDLRLRAVTVTDGGGGRLLSVPSANVSLALGALLLGRIQPRAVEIDHPSIRVYRSATGATSLDLGTLSQASDNSGADQAPPPNASSSIGLSTGPFVTGLLAEFGKPAGNDSGPDDGRFSQLRRLRIDDAAVVVVDQQLQATWRAPKADIDFIRGAAGGVTGHADLTVSLGDQTARIAIAAELAVGGSSTHIRAGITPVAPAALALAAKPLAPLAALTAPVGATLVLDLGPSLGLQQARMTVQVAEGELRIGAATMKVVDGVIVAAGDQNEVALESARLAFRGHDGGAVSVLSAKGTVQRDPDRLHTELTLLLDQVSFADLPHLWPQGTGGGARGWITQNITTGTARNGQVQAQIDVLPDFSDATLSAASGTLDGDGLTVYWLRPIQPIDHGVAQLRILDPDNLEIDVQSGRQRPEGAKADSATGGLTIRGGSVRIAGIMQHRQIGTIDADIAGSLTDALAVLRSPRLHLLDHSPIDLKDVAGQVATKLSIVLPLEDKATMDDITISTQSHLDGVHVGGLAAGHDLDQGSLDLKAGNDGLTLTGTATLADIPAKLDAAMDFRAGPPSQVLQTVNVTGQPSAAQLAAGGLNPGGIVTGGSVGLRGTLTERRDGQGQLSVSADLTPAALRVDVAGWNKAAGTPAQADAAVRLAHDRLVGIDGIRLTGGGASVQARATFTGGKASVLQIDQFTLGATVAKGSVQFPGNDGPIAATVSGSSIDLSRRLSYHAPQAEQTETDRISVAKPPGDHQPGQAWTVDAKFDRAIMANGQIFDALTLRAADDGTRLTRLHLDARAGAREPILLDVTPAPGGRRLTASASDAGRLLRALDVMKTMEGGRLTVTGSFDDRVADQPLTGNAEIEDFRVRDAPAMARLLQAMTLYGLVDLVGGPGLGFTRAVAPFRLTGSVLELSEARAYSPSLGLTAKGRIDLGAQRCDIEGTVVPAYFFNSLLGRVPFIGKLFSPEQGGGLFAANYSVRGPLADPTVSVNPLSALTPGILRNLFGKP